MKIVLFLIASALPFSYASAADFPCFSTDLLNRNGSPVDLSSTAFTFTKNGSAYSVTDAAGKKAVLEIGRMYAEGENGDIFDFAFLENAEKTFLATLIGTPVVQTERGEMAVIYVDNGEELACAMTGADLEELSAGAM